MTTGRHFRICKGRWLHLVWFFERRSSRSLHIAVLHTYISYLSHQTTCIVHFVDRSLLSTPLTYNILILCRTSSLRARKMRSYVLLTTRSCHDRVVTYKDSLGLYLLSFHVSILLPNKAYILPGRGSRSPSLSYVSSQRWRTCGRSWRDAWLSSAGWRWHFGCNHEAFGRTYCWSSYCWPPTGLWPFYTDQS